MTPSLLRLQYDGFLSYKHTMIIEWFDTKEVVTFADGVALEIQKLFPAHQSNAKSRNLKKEQRRLNGLLGRVRAYVSNTPLNIYKKGKFLNTIKWKLRDAGNDEKFIDDIVALLATSLRT